jgi:putative ATP-binding cassette transporter
VDLTLRSGEVLFVVGGNGSGKTTLIKLLCGLYPPAAGEIRLNGVGIDNENRVHYRRHISAIFSDSVVMDGLAGSAYDKAVSAHPDLVRRLMLERAVKADNGLLEQAGGFSTGERKRFNLLLALLDQRPVLVFDEFAADQDPDAKAFFYRDVLPELKAQGRIVVVVTHDDRYFPVADRTLALERGMRPMLTDQGLALRVVRSAAAPEIAALVGDAQ